MCRATRAGTRTAFPSRSRSRKRLGISGKQEIEAARGCQFNAVCRESVFTYKEDWERVLASGSAIWLDYANAYITYQQRTTSRACGGRSRRSRQRPALSRPQEPAVLPALWDRALLA